MSERDIVIVIGFLLAYTLWRYAIPNMVSILRLICDIADGTYFLPDNNERKKNKWSNNKNAMNLTDHASILHPITESILASTITSDDDFGQLNKRIVANAETWSPYNIRAHTAYVVGFYNALRQSGIVSHQRFEEEMNAFSEKVRNRELELELNG